MNGDYIAYKASQWQWPPVATLLASVDNQTAWIVGLLVVL